MELKLFTSVIFISAAIFSFISCLFCMLGHSDYGISFDGFNNLHLGLWNIRDSQKHYALDFKLKDDMAAIPTAYKALNLEKGVFQAKLNSARVFLLFSHYSTVVVFFFSIMYALDILNRNKKGALAIVGANLINILLMSIACACMDSAYKELLSVKRFEWSAVLIWVGLTLSLGCLVISVIGLAADVALGVNKSEESSSDIRMTNNN